MNKKIITIFLFVILIPCLAYSGLSKQPQAFQQAGTGRSFNTAFSGIGSVFDTSALYINPAGLGLIENFEFSLFYGMYGSAWYNDIFAAFGIPVTKNQALGIGFKLFNGSNQGNDDLMQYNEKLSNFGKSDTQIIGNLGYGIGITEKIRLGLTVNIFYQNLNQADRFTLIENMYKRFEIGADIGFQFDLASFISTGLHIKNVLSYSIKNEPSTSDNFPISFRPGLTLKFLNERLLFNADVTIPTTKSPVGFNFGFSFRIAKWISFYAGAANNFFVGGFDFRPLEELIFYIGAGYNKSTSSDTLKFSNGDNIKGSFTLGLGVSFIIIPPSRKIQREVKDFIEAQKEMSRGNYGRAMEILQDIQRSGPDNPDLDELTQEYLRVAQVRATSTDWMNDKDKSRIASYLEKGISEYNQRNFAEAIRSFRRVIDIYPAHKEANEWIARVRRIVNQEATRWYRIGEKHYIDGKLKPSEEALRNCLKIDPEYTPARELLTRIIGGDSVAALREGINVPGISTRTSIIPGPAVTETGPITAPTGPIMIAPRDETEKLFQQGEKQYYEAKYLDAITTLRRFNERSNNEELKLKANALIASAEKKYRDMENAQARKNRSRTLYELGMKSLRDNRFRDAIDAFEKSFVADPTFLQANQMKIEANKQLAAVLRRILNEGIALRDQKDYDGAINAFDRVILTDKDHELSLEAERLKKATLEERRGAADRHLAIAKDALRTRQYQAALTNFNVVLSIQPQNREALQGRSDALKQFQAQIDDLLKQGRDELNKKNYLQSIVFFDRVLIIDRNNRAAIEGKKQAQDIMERATTIRSVQENIANAKLRLENRDYEVALEALNNIIKVQPNNIEAIELRKKCIEEIEKEKERRKIMTVFSEGARAFRRRNYDIAIQKWNEVLALQKNSKDFDSRIIQEYIQRANILKQEAGNIALREGDAFFNAKQYKKAKERYSEALQRSPNNADIQLKLTRVNQMISQEVRNAFREGENNFSEGKYDEAIKSYKKIIDYEDEGSEIANSAKDELQRAEDALEARKKGDAFIDQKNYSDAITQYEYLIAINKKDKYAEEKRRDAIVALSREAQKLKQEGITLLSQKNYARAITLLGIVVRIDPDDNEAKAKLAQAKQEATQSVNENYERGVRAFNAQNWRASIDAFNIVRSIDPNFKETNKFYRRALENQNRISAQADSQRQGQLQALFYQGISLYRQNKLREAIEVWNRILAVDPTNQQAIQYIQRARFRLGG